MIKVLIALLTFFIAIGCNISAYAGLAGEWTYNEPLDSQTIYDQTSGNTDMIRGSTTAVDEHDPSFSSDQPHAVSGSAMSFDGGDYLWRDNTTPMQPAGNYTLTTWVKLHSLDLGDQDILISNIGAYNISGGYQLFFNGGATPQLGAMFRPQVGADYPDMYYGRNLSAIGWDVDTWYHVAATFTEIGSDSTQIDLYLDAKPIGSAVLSGQTSFDNTPYFVIGTNYDDNTHERRLNGKLEDTQVYNHALDGNITALSSNEVLPLAEIDLTWNQPVSDSVSNKSLWEIPKIPGFASNVLLPEHDGTPYTVTSDIADWEINSLFVAHNATLDLQDINLNVNYNSTIAGIVDLNGNFTVTDPSGDVTITGTGELRGGGRVTPAITNNGTVRATSDFALTLNGNQNDGTLIAGDSSVMTVMNEADLINNGSITMQGGTLSERSGIVPLSLINKLDTSRIQGYGTISYGEVVNNGTIAAKGGNLIIDADLDNNTNLIANGLSNRITVEGTTKSGTGHITIANKGYGDFKGVLTNEPDGIVDLLSQSTLVCHDRFINQGEFNASDSETTFHKKVTGTGAYSLQNANLLFKDDLELTEETVIRDNNVRSSIVVEGNLVKLKQTVAGFDADDIEITFLDLDGPGTANSVEWHSDDRGAYLSGLDDNAALNSVNFGGSKSAFGRTDTSYFTLTEDTILYCYGLIIDEDALVDLGGATIYYLRDGYTYNDKTGTGFTLLGSYKNGTIQEIPIDPVPEPATMLMGVSCLILVWLRRLVTCN